MKATIVGSELHIELDELHRHLSPEVMNALAQHAVFQDTLLEAVCDTVATGVAFDGDWWIGGMENRLREKLLPLMPQAVQELCRAKIREAEQQRAEADALRRKLWDLARHWPDGVAKPEWWDHRHDSADSYPFTREEADAWLARKLGADEWERIKAMYAAKESEVVECTPAAN